MEKYTRHVAVKWCGGTHVLYKEYVSPVTQTVGKTVWQCF